MRKRHRAKHNDHMARTRLDKAQIGGYGLVKQILVRGVNEKIVGRA
jgi:hypothetical protein